MKNAMLEKVAALYNAKVYRFNYRNGDYASIIIDDATLTAPVANCLLAIQYVATEMQYTGNVQVDCGYFDIRITFTNGKPTDLSTSAGGYFIYGLDVLNRRAKQL